MSLAARVLLGVLAALALLYIVRWIVIERRAPNPAMQFTMHMAGRIRDGRLEAKGGFTDGRSATLNLKKGR